jgi:hypothetical protein
MKVDRVEYHFFEKILLALFPNFLKSDTLNNVQNIAQKMEMCKVNQCKMSKIKSE